MNLRVRPVTFGKAVVYPPQAHCGTLGMYRIHTINERNPY